MLKYFEKIVEFYFAIVLDLRNFILKINYILNLK